MSGGRFNRCMGRRLGVLLVVLCALAGAATRASGSDVDTKFLWSGTIELNETIWLVDGGGCTGKISVTVHRVLAVEKKAYVAHRAGDVWEIAVTADQERRRDRCDEREDDVQRGVDGGRERGVGHEAATEGGAQTLRYDARGEKLEIVPTYLRELIVTGAVDAPGASFSGRESVVGTYALPRLERHPSQEKKGDFRVHVKHVIGSNPNRPREVGDAQFTRDSPSGGGQFANSPITSFVGFFGHVQSVGPRYQFETRVRTGLLAEVFGPDSDGDRVNDGADPGMTDLDSDNDGFPDYWEIKKDTDPKNAKSHRAGKCCPGAPDSDHDGYSDPLEVLHAERPRTIRAASPPAYSRTRR